MKKITITTFILFLLAVCAWAGTQVIPPAGGGSIETDPLTATRYTCGPMHAPNNIEATPAEGEGFLEAGTYYYVAVFTDMDYQRDWPKQTALSDEVSCTLAGFGKCTVIFYYNNDELSQGETQAHGGFVVYRGTAPGVYTKYYDKSYQSQAPGGAAALDGTAVDDGSLTWYDVDENVPINTAVLGTASACGINYLPAYGIGYYNMWTPFFATGELQVNGDTTIAKDLAVRGSANITGPIYMAGTISTQVGYDGSGDAILGVPSGHIVVDAADTTTLVESTIITAHSTIILQRDDSLGAEMSVTCNTQSSLVLGQPYVSARSVGASFTVKLDVAPTTNPMCISFWVVN